MDFLEKLKAGNQFRLFNSKQVFVYLGQAKYRRAITKDMNVNKNILPIYTLNRKTFENVRSVYDPKRKIQLGKRSQRGGTFHWYYH